MATRAQIAYLGRDMDRIITSYNHFDGYPKNLGVALKNHFNDDSKAKDIASTGYISYVDPKSGEVESKQKELPTTIIDEDLDSLLRIFYDTLSGADYVYLWIGRKWCTYKVSGGQDEFVNYFLSEIDSKSDLNEDEATNENFFKRLKSIPKATKLSFKIKNMIDKGKEYDYILAVLLQEIPNSTEEQIKKILDPFWEQNKPDTSSEDNISNQLDNLLSQEKLKENMKNQTEKARWAKLAGLPKNETKQQLDENIVGVPMVGNIFDREKEKYEDAFEYFLAERVKIQSEDRKAKEYIQSIEDKEEREEEKERMFVGESLNPEVSQKVNQFIKAMAKRYDYNEQDAVYAIMAALKQRDFDGLNEDTRQDSGIGSSVSKRRAGAELKQKLAGKRSDGMGKYDGKIYGLDNDGKRVELKSLNDLNKFTKFELDADLNESQLNEYTDNTFIGEDALMGLEQPSSEGEDRFEEFVPTGFNSQDDAGDALIAHDNSPIKARMGRYAPMFAHVQYHEFTDEEGDKYRLHQTQYYNSNFKDTDPDFNPDVTRLTLTRLDPSGDRNKEVGLGQIMVKTSEYIKDLKNLNITNRQS